MLPRVGVPGAPGTLGAPPGPSRLTSSALYVPCAYQPWRKTSTELCAPPVVNDSDSCAYEVADGVQVSDPPVMPRWT